MATPIDDTVCNTPGCVVRVEAGCPSGACAAECVLAHAGMCNALCDIPAPDCGARVPEVEAGCYTGFCIGASVCAG